MSQAKNLPLVRRAESRRALLRAALLLEGPGDGKTPPGTPAKGWESQVTVEDIARLVGSGKEHEFYCSPEWRRKRRHVLLRDKGECQLCKARGRYRKAVLVHHVLHLKDRPDLALCDAYTDGEGVEHRQLISVCRECHETVCHPERMRKPCEHRFTTQERWD